jgi:hypothetical protein
LLNSTPLGEVVNDWTMRRHRMRAGLRVGDSRHVDLLRYVAWLVEVRHAQKPVQVEPDDSALDILEATEGAAALGIERHLPDCEDKQTGKQQSFIAALLLERSLAAAAESAGVSRATAYRWMQMPEFRARAAYRQARRELLESAIGRLQAVSGQAVDTLIHVARQGRRDTDRVRAAIALLDRAVRGLAEADMLHGDVAPSDASPVNTTDVVAIVAARLRQLDHAELPTAEKSLLTAILADSLLRAIGVDVLDKRLAALQDVLIGRKDENR